MPNKPKIRPMRKDDWDIFQQLDTEIFDPHDHFSEEFFDKRVTLPGFFVMEKKPGNLIGYLILGKLTDEIAHLGRIGVKKLCKVKASALS